MPDGPPAYRYYVIVPHPREPRVLLVPDGGARTLPSLSHSAAHFSEVRPIIAAIKDQLGLNVTVLQCISDVRDAISARRVYAVENHNPAWKPPPGALWCDRVTVETSALTPPPLLAALEEWFDWIEEAPGRHVPWANRGWFGEAADWMLDVLDRLDCQPAAPVEQVRSWSRSCTLRAETTCGAMYFKAVSPAFSYEPVITRVLSQRYPENFPDVLAVDARRGWMLTRDIGGQTLGAVADIDRWEAAIRTYAYIQLDLSAHAEAFVSLGCPDRHLDHIASQIDRLMADNFALQPGTPGDLTGSEIAELRGHTSRLKDMTYHLLDYKVPLSLEHGDFIADNIVVRGDDFVFYDWSDSAVSHPFFDLLYFLGNVDEQFPDMSSARARLRNAYLEMWTDFEPMPRLIEAFEQAQVLSAVHRALVYHRVILPVLEPRARWEMEDRLPYYMRILLRRLRALSEK